nr:Nif11-like leader peptide family natural product precursor [Synechococcus sp. BIOS-E4-1]
MSPELERFFPMVAGSKDLQQQLTCTKEVADAAQLAQDLGFQITDAEVMLAQANRIISMPIRDQEQIAQGYQAEFVAQWRQGGQGYLNATGHRAQGTG